MVEEVANEVSDKVKIYEIDVDKNQETPSQFSIMAIPALLFFKDGKEVNRLGMAKKDGILSAVNAIAN